ncbi:MAG: efflux RND transporter periplasmic adaptor subunit [Mesorhizobium amorphae]|nr:MAG: efflux RND transporter periplasmic adaptor subunit [Mesorhizobium amorphae]
MTAITPRFAKALLLGTALAMGVPFAAAAPEAEAPPAAQRQAPPSIRVAAATPRELTETLSVTGTIIARDEAAVGTDVAGLIVNALDADQGDMVKKGDVLAVLDRRALDTQLIQTDASRAQAEAATAQVEAQIGDAEIGVRQAEEALRRAVELRRKNVSTQAELDNATNARDSAQAKLTVAQRALTASQAQFAVIDAQRQAVLLQIEKTEVRAPADGLVLERNATLGGIVSGAAGPLFRIAIGSEFEVAADVPETALARLEAGMKAEIHLAGLDAPLAGTIRRVSPEVNQQSRLGTIRITLAEGSRVRVGNFARGTIETDRHEALSVPASAVLFQGRDAFVQVVADGKVESRSVRLGIRAGDWIEIAEGLAQGEEVVARAGTFVADGDTVTPVREAAAGGVSP